MSNIQIELLLGLFFIGSSLTTLRDERLHIDADFARLAFGIILCVLAFLHISLIH